MHTITPLRKVEKLTIFYPYLKNVEKVYIIIYDLSKEVKRN